ncbi:hypothetical protein [Chryseobacterium ginsenosidimutans]
MARQLYQVYIWLSHFHVRTDLELLPYLGHDSYILSLRKDQKKLQFRV